MPARAARLLDCLEADRRALVERFDALGETVHASPGDGAWTLAQIADHLTRIEGFVRPDGRPASATDRALSAPRSWALRAALALPVRYAVPPGAGRIHPDADARWPEVRARWAEIRQAWRDAEPAPGTVTLRHPLVGSLLWTDTLAFLRAHHGHHDAQIERTLAALGH